MAPALEVSAAPATEEQYTIIERHLNEPRPFRVVAMGAGASGISFVYKMKQGLPDVDLVVYEKNSQIGGTWWENKYPGCACDSRWFARQVCKADKFTQFQVTATSILGHPIHHGHRTILLHLNCTNIS